MGDLLDAIFPLRCALCGAAWPGTHCDRHPIPARPSGPRCGRCAGGLAQFLPDGVECQCCRLEPPGLARVVTLGDYGEGSLRPWILALKHGGRLDLARPLGRLLGARASEVGLRGVLVPVPLHPLRRLARGGDQAHLLAREVYRSTALGWGDALRRVRRTDPQGSIGAPSRRANVRGAFALRQWWGPRVVGRDWILVDDVGTSLSTARECARILRRGGARSVSLLCLARAGGPGLSSPADSVGGNETLHRSVRR